MNAVTFARAWMSPCTYNSLCNDEQVRREKPDWEPSCILVDACAAEIAAIQMTFPSTVCPFIWHAQSAWKKQLFQKVTAFLVCMHVTCGRRVLILQHDYALYWKYFYYYYYNAELYSAQ